MSRSTLVSLFLLAITGTSTTDAFSPIVPSLRSTQCRTSSSSSTTARFVAVDTSDIKNGMTVELDNEPYKVLSFSIMKQARGAAKTTIKFKNLIRGTTIENTYRSGEKFETALIEKKAAQFTYKDEVSFLLLIFGFCFEFFLCVLDVVMDVFCVGVGVGLIPMKGSHVMVC